MRKPFLKILATGIAIAFLTVLVYNLTGCANDTGSSDQSTLVTSTKMRNSSVSSAFSKHERIDAGGITCDSVVITKARILISTMKLHRDEDDTVGKGTIKVGPFVAEFDASGSSLLSTVTIPPGTYDRIK